MTLTLTMQPSLLRSQAEFYLYFVVPAPTPTHTLYARTHAHLHARRFFAFGCDFILFPFFRNSSIFHLNFAIIRVLIAHFIRETATATAVFCSLPPDGALCLCFSGSAAFLWHHSQSFSRVAQKVSLLPQIPPASQCDQPKRVGAQFRVEGFFAKV